MTGTLSCSDLKGSISNAPCHSHLKYQESTCTGTCPDQSISGSGPSCPMWVVNDQKGQQMT